MIRVLPTFSTLALLIFSAHGAAAQRPPANDYRISAKAASCLLQNQARYQETQAQIIFVYAELCPTVRPSPDEISRHASNTVIEENPNSSIVVLKRREIPCFFGRLRSATDRSPRSPQFTVTLAGC